MVICSPKTLLWQFPDFPEDQYSYNEYLLAS